jgi:hypothetical protein
MTINSLTRPDDGIDNDSEWHQLIELMKSTHELKTLSHSKYPKSPLKRRSHLQGFILM